MKKIGVIILALCFWFSLPAFSFNDGGWGPDRETQTSVRFAPGDFVAYDFEGSGEGAVSITPITTTTIPSLEQRNKLPCLVWNDGETSYAQVTFKVPPNYISGGAFRAFVDYNTGTDNPEIHYRVFVHSDSTAWDTTATAQTAVDPAGTAGTPELVDLPIATDFATLSAGDIVSFEIQRSDEESSTASLELYYVEFYFSD